MANVKRPPIGARVQINVACPFECKSDPVWITAVVSDQLATQFVWTSTEAGSDRQGIAFYAHWDDTWRYADELL